MEIRESTTSDKSDIEALHIQAFGDCEGQEIAELVNDLLLDETAFPLLTLVTIKSEKIVGHILFTKATISQANNKVSAQLLAPLAVLPEAQGQGFGTQLIRAGLSRLKESGVDLVFVLGHPDYYPRHGFKAAGVAGFDAPYPIAEKDAAAWMVMALKDGIIGELKGTVQCASVLDHPQHWRE